MTQTYDLRDKSLRKRLLLTIKDHFPDVELKSERYCDYVAIVRSHGSKAHLRQYSSGKLVLQASESPLLDSILSIIEQIHPGAPANSAATGEFAASAGIDTRQPYIGTDESGKGDYFGPLVVAGVLVDPDCAAALIDLGVRDSKRLSDGVIETLATEIRRICKGRHTELVLSLNTYNDLYSRFASEGKNLNYMLAWCHATVIKRLLSAGDCNQVIVDKFGDDALIRQSMGAENARIKLVQIPKAEKAPAVAAASVLARNTFVHAVSELENEYDISLPKGASSQTQKTGTELVHRYGPGILKNVAKVHFSTTHRILSNQIL